MDIPKQYEPHEAAEKWFPYWEQHGYFNADPDPKKPPHTIMIPLPNVTGALHMGHALNGTLQDLLTRWRRMQGYEALWMPGTDHAGIATQAVVERRMLEEEGLTRHDIGRDALVNRIWIWKESYEARIVGQLKSLGASADWRRLRFTLDEVCSKAVRRTFFKLFNDGLIYRGKRLVNWDTFLQTAVADDEVFEEDVNGKFWTFHYSVVDESGKETDERISFSTTRPETMLGDTAVCVHPSDERYRHLIGKRVRIPLNNRLIPIIADGLLAKPEMGTGCVKVTPAHDPNDYACYQRHLGQEDEIGVINILNPDGTINEEGEAPEFEGKDRHEARTMIVERLGDLGHFHGVEDRVIPLKHSDRSKTPVEPYLSDQWFVRMGPSDKDDFDLAGSAVKAVEDGKVKFYPERYQKTYCDWLGEKRDWCISRQLWWGHRIPIWSKQVEGRGARVESLDEFDPTYEGNRIHFGGTNESSMSAVYADGVQPGETVLLVCVDEGHEEIEAKLESAGFVQDPDVLDTWFSSALWPHETLGWPDLEHNPPLQESPGADASGSLGDEHSTLDSRPSTEDGNAVLDYFYPTSVLLTSRDIITLWVARMVLTGLYNMGDVPFAHVHVHPKIMDGFGQTMSKSKGNGVDPVDLAKRYGTDAIRFTIASFAGETQDVRLPIGYECPHCGEIVPAALDGDGPMVKPETVKETLRGSATKLRMSCPSCNKDSQFSTPQYDPDPEEPIAITISERFEYGRNFCNKFWNAARFALRNLEGYTPGPIDFENLPLEDRWVLSRLSRTTNEVTELLGIYQFDAATRSIREFVWNEFCDWYLEMIKPRLRDEAERPAAQRMLVGVLDALLRLLHPFTPFLTEELWHHLGEVAGERGLTEVKPAEDACIIAKWPQLPAEWQQATLEDRLERLQETIVAVRNVRAIYNIAPSADIELILKCPEDIATDMRDMADQFDNLSNTKLTAAGPDVDRPRGSAGFTLEDSEGFIPLGGLIDIAAERQRQKKEADKLRGHITGTEKKLGNENFTSKAPPEVVDGVRETLAGLKKQLEGVELILKDLGEE
ncbi:valine--tRNA ligase [Stratiformator vulcanicus]|uniref:Valine--tRNA ligase n=1 Tax=Stratiformator vulcanicus TaxID=2527980 RepID=A0A517R6F1_9PLAN|nr:valine--tRNA ligase [Stratiformator vulcanicus]QDT39477.1 Valine--tRNA ligase [Stratiformator vulcanicus]